MELTGMQWLLTAFSFVLGIVVAMVLDEFLRKRDVPSVPRGLLDAVAFVGVSVLVAGMLVSPLGEALGLMKPAPPTPTVTPPGPTVANEGYVMAVASDRLTKAAIEGATVKVLLSAPKPGQAVLSVSSGTTGADGSCFFRLPGLTSGTVYVLGTKDGYYSEVATTTIPGPQVYPSEGLWAKLQMTQIGSISVLFENYTPNVTFDDSSGTVTLDNNSTLAQRFSLTFYTPTTNTGIKDVKCLMARLPDWSLVAGWSAAVSDAGGLTTTMTGDLSTSVSQELTGSGVLDYGKRLKLDFTVQLGSATTTGKYLAYVTIDDLLGGKGPAGESGADSRLLVITT